MYNPDGTDLTIETLDSEATEIAILSDTHGHLDERIANRVSRADAILHAGDIGSANVIRELGQICDSVFVVAGNNDRAELWPHEDSDVFGSIPQCIRLQLPGGILAMEHGHRHGHIQPCHDSLRQAHAGARIIVYGHTHKATKDVAVEPWVVNPGAAGNVRTHGGPSCALLFISGSSWFVEHHRFAD